MSRPPFLWKILGALILLGFCQPGFGDTASSPRERILFDDDWRFSKGDPMGGGTGLIYENLAKWIEASAAEYSTNFPQTRPEGNPGSGVFYALRDFDDHNWQQLNLPHDWAIDGPVNQKFDGETAKLQYWGPVWYRKHFNITAADSGKKIFFAIDGAMSFCEVWLNGQFVGGWPYGYTSFELDLTPFIKFGGENVLSIRLDTPIQASRWYPGGGIYRNVWLVKTAPIHITHNGICVTTPKVDISEADVQIAVTVANESDAASKALVKNEIFELSANGQKGKSIGVVTNLEMNFTAHQKANCTASLPVSHPKLWSVNQPNRYVVVTTVEQSGKVLDRYETPFGIRTIQFTANNGFLLNGWRVPIRGVCLHSDLGPLGMAFNTRALERQLQLLQTIGCNAIRTSHNPPAPELLDLCDRMGFVVMAEAFDCWAEAKRAGDYHLLFPDWHEADLRAFICNDRNHPSVILWSIGNEVYEQHDADGWKLGKQLADIVHQEDLTRPVTMALHTVESSTNGFQRVVDVFGYNYKPFDYATFKKHNPYLPLIGSETTSCVSSRGEYFFPVSDNKKMGRADFQATSYDYAAPSWANNPDIEFKAQDQNPFVAGEFVWTGFDYLGEPTPYDHDSTNRLIFTSPEVQAKWDEVIKRGGKIEVPSRSSYFGIFDLCGFRKDRAYLYQSRWLPDVPMAHIVPQNWNWPDRIGKVTPVQVYTSGDAAELFLNGKSLGVKKKGPFEYRLSWADIIYEPGTLKVVATKDGKKWATDIVKTTGAAAKLEMKADRAEIRADGKDLSFVTLTVEDRNGRTAPRAMNPIHFTIKGPGEIIATANGDATSHASFRFGNKGPGEIITIGNGVEMMGYRSFQSKEPSAFNGLCLAIIRAKAGESGKITLEAESDGLKGATVMIRSVGR